ncbi:MAG TPA: elongation factor G, partial [Dehalococcoidia bacterium]|nr:elongation factor G [Dehalococcoidia bacterium]
EMSFKMAAIEGMRKAMEAAEPVMLEPIMKLEVRTPESFFGDVLGDINSRRGHVADVETFGTLQIIRAEMPLAETFGYTTDLRSLTQGRATHTMEFDHYQEVPPSVAEKLGARAKVRR